MTTATAHIVPTQQFSSTSSADAQRLTRRAKQLVRTELDCIPNSSFAAVDSELELQMLEQVESTTGMERNVTPPKDLPAHLARMCESELLTAPEERELFFRMNFFKSRANVHRVRLDPAKPDVEIMQRVERLVAAAETVRDSILRANMRLVISVVKKFVTPQHSFDEMLSDGMYSLMQAVDKFDYDRGFRFSTYAYRAIARNSYRSITDRHRESSRYATGADETVFEAADDAIGSATNDKAWDDIRAKMHNMLHRLDRRERFIIRSRYALGSHRKVRTFQCLADKLGVSKERVRQLEQRAVSKLRTLAAELQMHDLVETALV